MEITCPSGMIGDVRGLTGSELNVLGDMVEARRNNTFDKILQQCWLGTVSSGPYNFGDSNKVDWGSVLLGDRFYALIAIRIATFGTDYDFMVSCGNQLCNMHQKPKRMELDLSTLDVTELPEESFEKFKRGDNNFEINLKGHTYHIRLMTGRDEKLIAQDLESNPREQLTASLNRKIVSIDGVENQDIRQFILKQSAGDQFELLSAFDQFDCGVDTNIDYECQYCGEVTQVKLPLDQPHFWIRKVKKTKTGKKVRKFFG